MMLFIKLIEIIRQKRGHRAAIFLDQPFHPSIMQFLQITLVMTIILTQDLLVAKKSVPNFLERKKHVLEIDVLKCFVDDLTKDSLS